MAYTHTHQKCLISMCAAYIYMHTKIHIHILKNIHTYTLSDSAYYRLARCVLYIHTKIHTYILKHIHTYTLSDSAYYRLARCGELLQKSSTHQSQCAAPIVMLRRWGLQEADGCSAFLCPSSGACLGVPAACPEGNPFSNTSSLYWTQTLAVSRG